MLNRLTRSYELQTTKSIEDILNVIKDKTENKKRNKDLFVFETINYHDFKINGHQIEIERWPSMFNPFRGKGIITFELDSINTGTRIKCTYGPIKLGVYMGIGMMAFVFIVMLSLMLIIPWDSFFKEISGIFVILIIPFGLMCLFSYWLSTFNTNQLEEYSKRVLIDLGVKTSTS